MAIIGLIVLAAAIYGIIRAIWRTVVEIVEIAAITLGSVLAVVVLAAAVVLLIRWQSAKRKAAPALSDTSLNPASPLAIVASAPGKPLQDPVELFAEAIANDMDPRFVERILDVAMPRPDK